jgi:ubiquinone/menaquinone biosynthesis C-methylase UbiE
MYTDVILDHYRQEAETCGVDASSTMRDDTIRAREIAGILRVVARLREQGTPAATLLDIGCGNGFLLGELRRQFPALRLGGIEYTPEMVAVAEGREVADCQIRQGDVCKLDYPDASWDIVVSERCIINVMDVADQAMALSEVARVLRPGGHFVCVEAFTDGLRELNVARTELGLPENEPPHHNLWFDKDWFLRAIAPQFRVVEFGGESDPTLPRPNFLSSHYFVSRVLYPAVTQREVLYNTHLVSFFGFLPPMGNYAPIQFYVLERR